MNKKVTAKRRKRVAREKYGLFDPARVPRTKGT